FISTTRKLRGKLSRTKVARDSFDRAVRLRSVLSASADGIRWPDQRTVSTIRVSGWDQVANQRTVSTIRVSGWDRVARSAHSQYRPRQRMGSGSSISAQSVPSGVSGWDQVGRSAHSQYRPRQRMGSGSPISAQSVPSASADGGQYKLRGRVIPSAYADGTDLCYADGSDLCYAVTQDPIQPANKLQHDNWITTNLERRSGSRHTQMGPRGRDYQQHHRRRHLWFAVESLFTHWVLQSDRVRRMRVGCDAHHPL